MESRPIYSTLIRVFSPIWESKLLIKYRKFQSIFSQIDSMVHTWTPNLNFKMDQVASSDLETEMQSTILSAMRRVEIFLEKVQW